MELGLGLGISRGGLGGLALGRVLDLDMATGRDYSALPITSSSAIGLVKGHDGLWIAKPAGYLAGLEGARVNGSAPAWDDGSGNALSGVRWTGPKAETTTLNAYSKPTPGSNDWEVLGTDSGNVAGPDGNATSARRCTGDGTLLVVYRTITAGSITPYGKFIAKGAVGKHGFFHIDSGSAPFNRKKHVFTGGWDLIDINSPISVTATYIYFDAADRVASDHGDPFQTVDLFLLQGSSAPDACIPTTGTNLTRLAETVAFPQAIGTDWTAVMNVDLSIAPLVDDMRFIGTNNFPDACLLNYFSGDLAAWDGTTAFISGLSINSSTTKVGVRSRSSKITFMADGSLSSESPESYNTTGITNLYFGQDDDAKFYLNNGISRVQLWTRALSDVELLNA